MPGELFHNLHPSLAKGWLPLCRISDLTSSPKSFKVLGRNWVAYVGTDNAPRVFEDVCPHRRAPLSLGTCDDAASLRCPYHGWLFDESGQCIEIPALGDDATIPPRAKLTGPAAVSTSHGMVLIAIEDPVAPMATIAASTDDSFMVGDLPVLRTRGSAALLADNFLDMAHFPFVHAGTFGAGEEKVVPQYTVERTDYSFEAVYEHLFSNREDPAVATGERPLLQTRRLTYRYSAPFHLELAIDFVDAGGTNVIGFFLCPEDEETVRIYSTLWRNDLNGSEAAMQEAIDFEIAVIDEDLQLQSRFETLSMPVDVTAEVHTRADRTTIELRRILSDFIEATTIGRAGEI